MATYGELLDMESALTAWLAKDGLEWRYKQVYGESWIQVRKKGSWFGFGWVLIGRADFVLQVPGDDL